MQINFHSLLWSYSPRVPIFLAMTVYIYIYIYTYYILYIILYINDGKMK